MALGTGEAPLAAGAAGSARPADRPLLAAMWVLGAVVGFSAMAVAGRQVMGRLDSFEVLIWRSALGLVIVAVFAAAQGRLAEVRPHRMGLHLIRNVVHFGGQNAWLIALTMIPLAQVFALEFTYPILVALSAPLLLGERMRPVRLLAAALGFAGILVVVRPWGAATSLPGVAMALAAAVGFAGTAIATKRLTRSVSTLAVLFWLCTIQMTLALVCALADGQMTWPGPALWPALAAVGVCGLAAHACLTTALSLAPATTVTPVEFLRLPLIAVVGMLLYGEPLDVWVFVGGAVIFFANWLNLRAEGRPRR